MIKLAMKSDRTELEQAQLEVEIAQIYLDTATSKEHFELLCNHVTLAEAKLDLAYKTNKILEGMQNEKTTNSNNSRNSVVHNIVGKWRRKLQKC